MRARVSPVPWFMLCARAGLKMQGLWGLTDGESKVPLGVALLQVVIQLASALGDHLERRAMFALATGVLAPAKLARLFDPSPATPRLHPVLAGGD